MKLQIRFAEEIRFDVPQRTIVRAWTRLLSGTRYSMRSPTRAELPKPNRRANG